jgi:rhodanese-related sulfurtransferase
MVAGMRGCHVADQAKPLDPHRQSHAVRRPRTALIDLREERLLAHHLRARSIPLRLERFARPGRARIPASCCVMTATAYRTRRNIPRRGYTDLLLQGGPGLGKAGFELFSGVNVPSKAFGEHIEHACGTPSVSAEELDGLMRSGTDMVVVDSRPFDEFQRVSIPSATNVPGAELVLRIHDIVPSPDTQVVVNCAGRTRSIIGAQSLINAGVPNKVGAQRHHGMDLAGLMPDSGKARFTEPSTAASLLPGGGDRVVKRFGVMRIDPERWKLPRRPTRTLYVFDARSDRRRRPFSRRGRAPGGQLVRPRSISLTLGAGRADR